MVARRPLAGGQLLGAYHSLGGVNAEWHPRPPPSTALATRTTHLHPSQPHCLQAQEVLKSSRGALMWHGRDLRHFKRILAPPLQQLLTQVCWAGLLLAVCSWPVPPAVLCSPFAGGTLALAACAAAPAFWHDAQLATSTPFASPCLPQPGLAVLGRGLASMPADAAHQMGAAQVGGRSPWVCTARPWCDCAEVLSC